MEKTDTKIETLGEFVPSKQANLFIHPNQKKFLYSDGNIEHTISNILQKSPDNSIFSYHLDSQIYNWPTEYHFSAKRHNLLRHIHFNRDHKILELGAGCGAITRQLGESEANVIAIEGSLQRAQCAAFRCKDLPNVKVYCRDFQKIKFSATYDFVTLIGVLEYSPLFFETSDPFISCLEIAKKALKPGGKLLIAIENQLGLKYFCGYPEDHIGKRFYGIENLYKSNSVKTLGRFELHKKIQNANFKHVVFQYPFPDYKLPDFVFTEKAFSTPNFQPQEIISSLSKNITANHRASSTYIREDLALEKIVKNKLATHLSNSFLILASDKEILENDTLAFGYSIRRDKPYHVMLKFEKEIDNIMVYKSSLFTGTEKPRPLLEQHLGKTPYFLGQSLDLLIHKKIATDDYLGIVADLQRWIDFIKKEGIRVINEKNIHLSMLKYDFIDCIPKNIIFTSANIEYIDKEWSFCENFSLQTIILRFLYPFCISQRSFLRKHCGCRNVLQKLTAELGITLNQNAILQYQKSEQHFYSIALRDFQKNYNSRKNIRWRMRLLKSRIKLALKYQKDALRIILYGRI